MRTARIIGFLALLTALGLASASGFADETNPPDPSTPPNQTRTKVTPSTTPRAHIVGVRPPNEVHGQPSSQGALDESNASNMGVGFKFNLGKRKSKPAKDSNQESEHESE